MPATLMWTINDFPAYGMLSRWMAVGKLACPYCMEDTKSFTLRHGRKNSWFNCHHRFLPPDNEFRSKKYAFEKNKTEQDGPPPILTCDDIWLSVQHFPKVAEEPPYKFDGFDVAHNGLNRVYSGSCLIGRIICLDIILMSFILRRIIIIICSTL